MDIIFGKSNDYIIVFNCIILLDRTIQCDSSLYSFETIAFLKAYPSSPYTGEDFIYAMAQFWESRPTFNDTKGQWEINGD